MQKVWVFESFADGYFYVYTGARELFGDIQGEQGSFGNSNKITTQAAIQFWNNGRASVTCGLELVLELVQNRLLSIEKWNTCPARSC